MLGKIFKFVGAIFALLLLLAFTCTAQSRITGIQAKLFYQNTGTFSADVFTTPSDLWNVYFDYVYSTLIVIEVEGKDDGKKFITPQKLEFIAQYKPFEGSSKEITVRKTSPIWFDENGKAFVGFWIDNVGCHPIKISVKIKGQKTRLRKVIGFGCGE